VSWGWGGGPMMALSDAWPPWPLVECDGRRHTVEENRCRHAGGYARERPPAWQAHWGYLQEPIWRVMREHEISMSDGGAGLHRTIRRSTEAADIVALICSPRRNAVVLSFFVVTSKPTSRAWSAQRMR